MYMKNYFYISFGFVFANLCLEQSELTAKWHAFEALDNFLDSFPLLMARSERRVAKDKMCLNWHNYLILIIGI